MFSFGEHAAPDMHPTARLSARPQASIGVVVVLFDPSGDELARLARLARSGVVAVAVDNTLGTDGTLRSSLEAIALPVLGNGNRGGVAGAFNLGIDHLGRLGATVFVLLDQDSELPDGFFAAMQRRCDECIAAGTESFILGPRVFDRDAEHFLPALTRRGPWLHRIDFGGSGSGSGPLRDCAFLISSGCLVSTDAWRAVGRFREDFVIDHVDTEYSLRAAARGVPMFIVPELTLRHVVGQPVATRVLGVRVRAMNHGPTRRYYLARNAIALMRLYPTDLLAVTLVNLLTLLQLVTVVLSETNKRAKCVALAQGIIDGVLRRSGPFERLHPQLAARFQHDQRQGRASPAPR